MKKLAVILSAMFFATAVWAQQPEKEKMEGDASPAVSALRLAGDLIKHGYAQESALSLVNALDILTSTPVQDLDAERQSDATGEATDDSQKEGIMTFDVEQIMADAKEFAEGDATVMALISEMEKKEKGGHRGAVNGSKRAIERVLANSTDTYNISFIAGELAEVAVIGDGDTDLDLYVYDSNGNAIASDTDYTDNCYVSWTPRWTGRFIIKIVNRGNVYNNYVIMTN